MNQSVQEDKEKKAKPVTIIVNASEHHVEGPTISFSDLVRLAFDNEQQNVVYTISYSRGTKENQEGTMSKGDTVAIKSGMNFNVSATNKS